MESETEKKKDTIPDAKLGKPFFPKKEGRIELTEEKQRKKGRFGIILGGGRYFFLGEIARNWKGRKRGGPFAQWGKKKKRNSQRERRRCSRF